MFINENWPSKLNHYDIKKFFRNFGFKNGCQNEFEEMNEKIC